jgi:uncharacterized MAPEG superfamily protein
MTTLRHQQRRVAAGLVAGAVAGGFLYLALRETLPAAPSPGAARIWLLLVPAALVFAMTAAVGRGRFLSPAIDPLAGAENRFIAVTGRALRNTIEQSVVFVLAGLALTELAPDGVRGVLPAVAVLFAIARLAFWIGYLIDPIHRAAGMALTMLINMSLLVWAGMALLG